MPDTARTPETNTAALALDRMLAAQKRAFDAERYPSRTVRAARLDRLIDAVAANEQKMVDAISADFGNRSRHETIIAEVVVSLGAARHAKRHLDKWMRHRAVKTPLTLAPGKSRIEAQPLGVIGVISPWNYPAQLALSPLSAALAAGNRVMIKPSELTPATAQMLAEMLSGAFDEDEVAVVTGGVEIGQAFSALPFDHLLFTGSTSIGRHVYMAAAANLTPVTLELGGKSP
ncbi:MAG: aldehyde dehydrogenase family protein, partial [Parvularculaceae bacterium]